MTATTKDVQAKLDAAVVSLKQTRPSYPSMVKQHGSDWTKWPTDSPWYVVFNKIRAARSEVGALAVSSPPTAAFIFKEG